MIVNNGSISVSLHNEIHAKFYVEQFAITSNPSSDVGLNNLFCEIYTHRFQPWDWDFNDLDQWMDLQLPSKPPSTANIQV